MTHDTPLPECERRWKEFDKHADDSVSVRETVAKSSQQVLTLEKAHEATMADIKEIKESLLRLERMVMTAAITGLIVLVGEALYFGGYLRQIDVNSGRIAEIEQMHPRNVK